MDGVVKHDTHSFGESVHQEVKSCKGHKKSK